MTKKEIIEKLQELEIVFDETETKDVLEALLPEDEKVKKVDFPQVGGNGKYQAVKVDDKYVVYSPDGARVSGVLTLSEANDICRQQNQAAHIKIK